MVVAKAAQVQVLAQAVLEVVFLLKQLHLPQLHLLPKVTQVQKVKQLPQHKVLHQLQTQLSIFPHQAPLLIMALTIR